MSSASSFSETDWLLWLDQLHAAAVNMAVDDILFQQCPEWRRPVLRIYGWDSDAVSIGYFQKYAAAEGAAPVVVRRPTGGGLVRHDADLTFTVAAPMVHSFARLHRLDSYRAIHQAVQEGLRTLQIQTGLTDACQKDSEDPACMICFQAPVQHDVVLGANTKVGGGAQRRNARALLHQGSLNFSQTPFRPSAQELTDAIIQGFQDAFQCVFQPFQHAPDVLEQGEELARRKYARDDWTRRR